MERYKEVDTEDGNPFKDQDAWEAHQSKHAKLSTGAEGRERASQGQLGGKAYDFVFEDQVEFIKEDLMAGNADLDVEEEDESAREMRLRALEEKDERARMAATRASLPIYQYVNRRDPPHLHPSPHIAMLSPSPSPIRC